jgi:outer membrane receptor protein involved in Fe transport
MYKLFLSVLFTAFSFSIFGQTNYSSEVISANLGVIKGKVIEASSNQPIEYTNIVLYRLPDSSMVTGTISKNDGTFELTGINYGKYYLVVHFIGFNKIYIPNIILNRESFIYDVGTLSLTPSAVNIEDVQVVGDKPRIEYKIDKKVINVSQQLNASGGTAVDILENVPSVKVDEEGNVTLRGSSNFTVLIDGRPTFLKGTEALEQIPASAIENIEIITNPSAKYDPEGVAGIINIVMKKNALKGLNGIVNLSVGNYSRYRGNLLLNYKTDKFKISGGLDAGKGGFQGQRNISRQTFVHDSITYLDIETNNYFDRPSLNLKGAVEYYLNPKTTLSLDGDYGLSARIRNSYAKDKTSYSFNDQLLYKYTEELTNRTGRFYDLNFNFHQMFEGTGHELLGSVNWSSGGSDDNENHFYFDTNENYDTTGLRPDMIKSLETDHSNELRIKVDYTRPLNNGKIETGAETQIENEQEDMIFQNYLSASDSWINNPEYSNKRYFRQDIYSAYFTWSGNIKKLGYQLGVRGEYTFRDIRHDAAQNPFIIDTINIFPTLHLSYKINDNNQLMTSYTRRIQRPEGRMLEPFVSFRDAYNVMFGNPALKNEYVNSFELSYQKTFGASFVSLEGYYRITENKIDMYMSRYNDSIYGITFANLDKDYSLGVELMTNIVPARWLRINLSGDLFDYRLKGSLASENVDRHSTNWSTRLSTTFLITENTRIQLDGFYNGPSVSAQGKRYGSFGSSLSLRQDFLKKQLNVILNIRNPFGTMKFGGTSSGEDFNQTFKMKPAPNMITLTLSYKINNYKKQNGEGKGNSENDSEGSDMGGNEF